MSRVVNVVVENETEIYESAHLPPLLQQGEFENARNESAERNVHYEWAG